MPPSTKLLVSYVNVSPQIPISLFLLYTMHGKNMQEQYCNFVSEGGLSFAGMQNLNLKENSSQGRNCQFDRHKVSTCFFY